MKYNTRRVTLTYLGEHLSLSELLDLANGAGSSLLELDFVDSLVEIDGVVSGHGLDLLLLSFLNTRHFLSFSNILIINIEFVLSLITCYIDMPHPLSFHL